MQEALLKLVAATWLAASLAACQTAVAPGAEKVRITESAADVQSCKAVGNVNGANTGASRLDLSNAAVGLGGDTVLMTKPLLSLGIAYRCAKD